MQIEVLEIMLTKQWIKKLIYPNQNGIRDLEPKALEVEFSKFLA